MAVVQSFQGRMNAGTADIETYEMKIDGHEERASRT
jgi:hypothetical protein